MKKILSWFTKKKKPNEGIEFLVHHTANDGSIVNTLKFENRTEQKAYMDSFDEL